MTVWPPQLADLIVAGSVAGEDAPWPIGADPPVMHYPEILEFKGESAQIDGSRGSRLCCSRRQNVRLSEPESAQRRDARSGPRLAGFEVQADGVPDDVGVRTALHLGALVQFMAELWVEPDRFHRRCC